MKFKVPHSCQIFRQSVSGTMKMKLLMTIFSLLLVSCSSGMFIDHRKDFKSSAESGKFRIVTKLDQRHFTKEIEIRNDTIQFNGMKLPKSEIHSVAEYRYSRKKTLTVVLLAPAAVVLLGAAGYIGYSSFTFY